MTDIQITGLSDLMKTLDELPAKLEANIVRGGLRAGCKVIADEAKALAPVHTGELRSSVRVSARIKAAQGLVTASVVVGSKKAWYAHLVEFGTAAHLIRGNFKKDLSFGGVVRGAVEHPGAKPNPFVRVAMDSKQEQAVQAMADYISARLDKEALK